SHNYFELTNGITDFSRRSFGPSVLSADFNGDASQIKTSTPEIKMNKFALLFLSLVAAGSGLLTAAVRAEEPAPSAMPKAASEGHEMM
ncbi:hypothetical protein, partial [Acinetobacter baumannii]|uniref:hypothetical protein n=1 Tax=Acinetobacter baumannii TaxID=470 RepID=UPI001C09EDD6